MTEPRSGRARTAVVGATGFLGRHVCQAVEQAGHDLLGIARAPGANPPARQFTAFDIAAAEPEDLAGLLRSQNITTVINTAGGWGRTEEDMVSAHVRLVQRLTAAAALNTARGVAPLRVVQVGSIHEYGPVPEGTAMDEWVSPKPVTRYGQTKLAGSQEILRAAGEGHVHGVVLRVVNVCGPRTTPASFLGTVVSRLRDIRPGQRLELSIAPARRDYVDVRDVARAVLLAARAPLTARVVNVGRGEAVPIRDLLALLTEAAGLPPETLHETGGRVESRGGDWVQADIRLARELLDWTPRIGLRESMRDMWEAADATASV
ncbi:hypothetical protein GCM10009716_20600 [Streptomyces sodiiphilus]|uniref:NAD-dependent epimerase/dehydratase domain-containing protein n=1 Tax=Streptomyces sodiiphilus TaxID=226217 RepID=A0ABN2P4E5_9ACTN